MKLSVILLVALLIIPISSSFAQEKQTGKSEKPSFTLIPEAGPAGTVVDVLASGFPSDWKITLPPSATSDSTTTNLGSFEFKVTIPANAKDGPYIIPVKVGDVNFKAVFTVRHAWHGSQISPPSSYVPGKFVNSTKQNSEFKLGGEVKQGQNIRHLTQGTMSSQATQAQQPNQNTHYEKNLSTTLPNNDKHTLQKIPSQTKGTFTNNAWNKVTTNTGKIIVKK